MLERNLRRQLKKAKLSTEDMPQNKEQWQAFIDTLNSSYVSNKDARYLLEKSLDESSREMAQLNKELKEEAERRINAIKESKIKSRFMENMSHEIRTPIHGILGSLEIIKDNKNLDSTQSKFINTALISGENLLDIVNNILDFSKINAGELDLEEITFDIRELLSDVHYVVKSMTEEKKLQLVTDISNDVPQRIKGDPAKVRQIIMNLATNAIKFTPHGSLISAVNLLEQNDNRTILRFEITDTGIGISEEKVDEIFKAFTQVDASTTRQFEGVGLGLTISKELVHLMGGTINLESVEGKGTHFWVDIPFTSVMLNLEEKPPSSSDLSNLRVLVVEKEKTSLTLLDHYFSKWAIDYQLVDSSREGVVKLYESRQHRAIFDVVLIDYFMPGMDSLELSEILNTHADFQGISKVTLSSYNLAKEEREIANIDICLTKPIRENMLKDILLECLHIKNEINNNKETSEDTLLNDLIIDSTDVLLAEDNPVNALIAVTMIEQIGFSVKHVTDGQQAVDEVKNNHYKLVLMDMHMPVMDGYKATQTIRQWEKNKSSLNAIPIIALTANALAGDKDKCLSAGMDDYLPKPVKRDILHKVVTAWVGKEQLF
jgi:signal transduction histidine kinase/DNA-binding response OmpR family regulator